MSHSAHSYDVIVLGGGAAGLMCAAEAGQGGKRVLLIERNESVGRKIEISGGGRCNFTNLGASAENYLSQNPDFCRSALARYSPWDFIALVEKHGIRYHEKTLGQQFCDGSSRQIIEMLLKECMRGQVDLRTGVEVDDVERVDRFSVSTSNGVFESSALVLATGGLSFPKLGATNFAYRIARKFGLRVTAVRPALVPLTFGAKDQALQSLSGISLPVTTASNGVAFREGMLVTHRGLSGPAILQVSSYWKEGGTISINLLPESDAAQLLLQAKAEKRELVPALGRTWPRRFAEIWSELNAPPKPLAQFKDSELRDLGRRINAWPFQAAGSEGYAKAEVTLGGIDTTELSSKTMEARSVPGLFCIGEAVDVTGWLGGYNFQWAWASAVAAAGGLKG
ncbi:MAG TPA: NAD(P)/FAD-dependent oxidoreductase [Chthoniobacteraceae bacterium]|nr:NAD(P)/FAD-dependent oxidoreductase [Chthoniobacteraceae bacterium]